MIVASFDLNQLEQNSENCEEKNLHSQTSSCPQFRSKSNTAAILLLAVVSKSVIFMQISAAEVWNHRQLLNEHSHHGCVQFIENQSSGKSGDFHANEICCRCSVGT